MSFFCVTFSFWDMVDFVLNIRSVWDLDEIQIFFI